MASIQKRPNGRYRARYRCDGCRSHLSGSGEHTKFFILKRDADTWIADQVAALARGEWTDPLDMRMTVAKWCEQWLEGYASMRPSTVRQARVHIAHINAEFGSRRLVAVRPSHIKSWTARLAREGYAASTVYATYRRLAQIMGDAAHDGLIPRSPCSRRVAPPMGSQRPYVASLKQVWALHDAMPAHLAPAVLLGAFVGLRISEAAALRPGDIDFMRGVVRPEIQYPDEPLKTEVSKGAVPIPNELSLLLAAAVEVAKAKAGDKATTIVTDELGRPSSPWAIERATRRLRGSVEGLPDGFRYHDLRHFYASQLIDAGLSVKVVQSCMRHGSATTTLNTYGHLFPDADESARVAISAAIADRGDFLGTRAGQ